SRPGLPGQYRTLVISLAAASKTTWSPAGLPVGSRSRTRIRSCAVHSMRAGVVWNTVMPVLRCRLSLMACGPVPGMLTNGLLTDSLRRQDYLLPYSRPVPQPPVESIQAILTAPGRALRYRLRGAGIARARASGPVVSPHPGGASIECSHARGSHHPRASRA